MRKAPALAAALLVAGGACSRCGARHPPPERFLAADRGAVVVPRVRALGDQLAPALRTLATFPAAADVAEQVGAVRAQLGFDPLDARGLEEAGLDPSRGAAAELPAAGGGLLVLPVGDAGTLDATVTRLARDRLGAAVRGTATLDGRVVTTFSPRLGAPPVLALLLAEGSALVAAGEGAAARVASAATRPPGAALSGSAPYALARALLGDDPAVIGWAPPGATSLAGVPLLRDGAAVGVSAAATRLTVRAALLLPRERGEAWRAALGPGADAGADGVALLPADAFLAARAGGDPAALVRRVVWALPARSAAALARAGVDLERDAADVLAPGAAVGVALAPTFEVGAAQRGPAGLRGADLFRLVHVAAVLHVKDPARARAALDRLADAAPRLGLAAERRAVGDRPGWRFAAGATALDVALDGARLLAGGGPGRLDALLAADGPRYRPPADAARAALAGGSAGAVLDLGQLVRSFRALPSSAYGTGPDAFVMRALAERIVDPAARLSFASARLELAQGGARAEVVVEARPPEGGAP